MGTFEPEDECCTYPLPKFQYLFTIGQGKDVRRHLSFVLNTFFVNIIPNFTELAAKCRVKL